MLVELLDMTSVITANIQAEKDSNKNSAKADKAEEKMANGIVVGTNYRVYAVHKVSTLSGEIVQLVHLRYSSGLDDTPRDLSTAL